MIGRCYTDIGVHTSDIADCQAGGFHGTTSAEILADVAPNVTLYIANPPNWSDLRETVRWMVAQDVDVINQSLGWIWDGGRRRRSGVLQQPAPEREHGGKRRDSMGELRRK